MFLASAFSCFITRYGELVTLFFISHVFRVKKSVNFSIFTFVQIQSYFFIIVANDYLTSFKFQITDYKS